MKWLDRKREARVLRVLAAYGPCQEIDLKLNIKGQSSWLPETLVRLINYGDVESYIRPSGFLGGYRMYRLPKGN